MPEAGYAVSSDLTLLPEAVRAKHAAVTAPAQTGMLDQLGPILVADQTLVSFNEPPVDYVMYLSMRSRDGAGFTTLAAMLSVCTAPYAAMDDGEGGIVCVWPHFVAMDTLANLTRPQLVEAYRLVTHEELDVMPMLDAWISWRAEIDAEGRLTVFVAGD